jgi:hypothetical protein
MRTLPHSRLFLGRVKKKAENEDGTAAQDSMQKDTGSNKEKWFRDKKKKTFRNEKRRDLRDNQEQRFRDELRRACATTRVS